MVQIGAVILKCRLRGFPRVRAILKFSTQAAAAACSSIARTASFDRSVSLVVVMATGPTNARSGTATNSTASL